MQIRNELSLRPCVHLGTDDRSTESHTPATVKKKGFERDREKQSRRKLCRVSPKGRTSMQRETLTAKWQVDPTIRSIGQRTT